MNQLLENPSDTEAHCADEAVAEKSVAAKGVVLLLEDDAALREVISDFLAEDGFTVVAVNSGVEGVQQVMSGEFAVILCDMMMPGVSGEMFYRAVERLRPTLCNRFIFLTGYRNDSKTNSFIESINGFVLRKPFHLTDLRDSMALAQVRTAFVTVCDPVANDAARGQVLFPTALLGRVGAFSTTPSVDDEEFESVASADLALLENQPERDTVSDAVVESEPGRVLLVDDDSSFNEIIRDFLAESGFSVVAVQSGGAGIREVLGGDFALVLCDVMMPALPGDMFYRAVERIRPELCDRFVFMTGHRGDEKTNDFIRSVNGKVLIKPFSMGDLMDTISCVRSSSRLGAVAKTSPRTVLPVSVSSVTAPPPKIERQAVRIPQRPPVEATAPVPPAAFASPVRRPAEKRNAESERPYAGFIWGAVAICVVLGGVFQFWTSNLRSRIAASTSKLEALDAEWTAASAQLQATERTRPRIETLLKLPARVAEDRQVQGWAPLLQSLANAAGAVTVFHEIHAHGIPANPGACELRLEGASTGKSPRTVADRFRKALEADLKRQFGDPVSVSFDTLEDEPKTAREHSERRAVFTITATVGIKPPEETGQQEPQ